MSFFDAILLGIVEGLTEFLPISSTGHLILTSEALGLKGDLVDSFNVAIQSGAILAVVVLYRHRFMGLLNFKSPGALQGFSGMWLLSLTTLPLLVTAYLFHKTIKGVLFGPVPVALALAAGGVAMIAIERGHRKPSTSNLDAITPRLALSIGLIQCLALWPGMSRAASTILGGRFLGLSRQDAAEYSFLAAVPVLVAATAYELISQPALISEAGGIFLTGFVVAFFTAWLAVQGFIAALRRWTLAPFGWYRLALAALVFGLLQS